MMEPFFDIDEAERLLRDAEAVLYELLPNLDEEKDRFASASFEAAVTNDDRRLLRLAEDAKGSALVGRHVAGLYEAFAAGIELHSMPLCRAAAHELRGTAQRELRYSTAPNPLDEEEGV